ncbi:MAG TPA: transglycosylase SLT domain-containing protein [Flavipsychrobacter sp.]|nr:transglycosylase SLT domain-containing protein [Flavipsychrobacter sp.]
MQYRGLLLASIFAIFSTSAHAQKYENFVMKSSSKVIETDTIVLCKGNKPQAKEQLLACNDIPVNSATKKANGKVEYKPVPLAGQKSYFGEMNDYVNDFVRRYLEVHDQTLTSVQGRSSTPFSLIDNVLEKNNIPKELKYLAVIESALNHDAVSHAGAVGPWQLMASTARLLGLTVNRHHDDRTDWYKSTNAAAKYLTTLYGELDDWLLVIAAYNSGPVPVERAIERTGSHNFWDIKKYLPRETQGHVLAFIATASIFENLSKFIGLGSIPMDFNFNTENNVAGNKKVAIKKPEFTMEELKSMAIVRISQPISLEFMANELGMDINLLNKWNPDYDLFIYKTYPSDFYSLRIPKDKLEVFIQKKDFLTKRSKQIFNEL